MSRNENGSRLLNRLLEHKYSQKQASTLKMLLFCPSCGNVLTVSQAPAPSPPEGAATSSTPVNRLECLTCPYQFLLTQRYFERKTFTRAEREDVFGGPGAWDNAQKQQGVQCPREGCEGEEAAYFQVQIRSADEPMTTFFKCMKCGHRWREN